MAEKVIAGEEVIEVSLTVITRRLATARSVINNRSLVSLTGLESFRAWLCDKCPKMHRTSGRGGGACPQTPPPDTRFARIAHMLWPDRAHYICSIRNYEFVFMLMASSLVPIPSVQEVLLRVWQRDCI